MKADFMVTGPYMTQCDPFSIEFDLFEPVRLDGLDRGSKYEMITAAEVDRVEKLAKDE